MGSESTTSAPQGDYIAYDMYGNEKRVESTVEVSTEPIYFVYK